MEAASRQMFSGLPKKLVDNGLLSPEEMGNAIRDAEKRKSSLTDYLVNVMGKPALQVAHCAADEFGMPLIRLDAMDPESLPITQVPEKLLRKHRVLPLVQRQHKLYVGIADPTNLQALDEIKFGTGLTVEGIVVEADKLDAMLDKALEAADTSMGDMLDEDLDNIELESRDEEDQPDIKESEIDDAPVVRFVNKVLLDAIKKKASDIHFEPYEKQFRVRFRVDGILQDMAAPPRGLADRIIARVKVMSRMDIAERRVPQDGRIKLNISKNRAIDFRVNTCPTLFGEKVVLRILDPSSAQLGIDMLGYEEDQKQLYLEALKQPHGMILVTGPTGSGKTVSLYTGLNILNTNDVNISTAEDPAEIVVPGINQVNVNPKVGLTFASALRAFLRQDPDIIMVGEIRDLETAEIAIKAAQTGHLVLSTLHTNDAPQTLTRLANMGVPAYNIASSVSLIIAQRLARRLCEHCKTADDVPPQELLKQGFSQEEVDAGMTLFRPAGCEQCNNSGYKGRVGIYQVMPVSEAMGRIIMEGGNASQLAEQAEREGIANLRRSGLKKVKAGITSLEEVNRVTKD